MSCTSWRTEVSFLMAESWLCPKKVTRWNVRINVVVCTDVRGVVYHVLNCSCDLLVGEREYTNKQRYVEVSEITFDCKQRNDSLPLLPRVVVLDSLLGHLC